MQTENLNTALDEIKALRRACWERGYRPLAIYSPGAKLRDGTPIKGDGKRPATNDWLELARRDPPDVVARGLVSPLALNTGLLAGEVSALDVDVLMQEVVDQIVVLIERTLGPSPLSRIGRAPKILLCYRADEPFAKLSTPNYRMPDGSLAHFEILGDGQQFVAFGVHPDTLQPYQWLDGSPDTVAIADLPVITAMQARDLVGEAAAIIQAAGGVDVKPPKPVRDPVPPHPTDPDDAEGESFFHQVNRRALGNIAAWAPALHPGFQDHGNNGWRVTSKDLGRDLEEDFAIHPDGIFDFGEERGYTAVDTVIRFAAAAGTRQAAFWLCEKLGVAPGELGWRAAERAEPAPAPSEPEPHPVELPGRQRHCPPAMAREAVWSRHHDWQNALLKNDKGNLRACLANAISALRHSPEWEDRIWHDAFHNRVVLRGVPPWSSASFDDEPWSDLFDNLATDWMQHQGIYVSHEITGRAVWTVAHEQWFHPVRQYLEACRSAWDDKKRVADWTATYLGTPKSTYSRAVGQRWLISLVARVMEPGCKADCSLVLEGPQGILKSELLRRLGHPWVTDDMGGSDPGSKDAAIQVAGIWLFELAELDQFTAGRDRDIARTKSFMSRPIDRFRPPYGRHAAPQPRQCGFACTTNKREYLPDETGNRRWWPISCTTIDLDGLVNDRDLLFGEAVALYEAGETWWLDTPELNALAADEQEGRYIPDAWEEKIAEHIATLSSVSVAEILTDVLKLEKPAEWDQGTQNRIVRCLRALRWEQLRVTLNGKRQRRYYPSEEDAAEEDENGATDDKE